MTLQDHFRPPLSLRRHWHAFHNAWATYLASYLNQHLPEGYFAEPNVQFGVEIDVATFEEAGREAATLAGVWVAPAPTQTVPIAVLEDAVEVLVFGREAGPTLAGAIELVSPSNKDRSENRDALVSKCASYLQQGVGLVVVDVVTGRKANLHQDVLARVGSLEATTNQAELFAVAYRCLQRSGQPTLDIWYEPLAIGQRLPTLPLWLLGGLCLPVDLAATYERTCREQRIPSGNG